MTEIVVSHFRMVQRAYQAKKMNYNIGLSITLKGSGREDNEKCWDTTFQTGSIHRRNRKAAEWILRLIHIDEISKKSRNTTQEMGRRLEWVCETWKTTTHGPRCMNRKRKKNNTRSTSSTTEERNSSQHHDDQSSTPSPASTTSPGAAKERLTVKTQCSWPSSNEQDETIRSILSCTRMCGLLHARHFDNQDRCLSDSLPACKASGELVYSILCFSLRTLTKSPGEFVSSFFQLVYPGRSQHTVHFLCLWRYFRANSAHPGIRCPMFFRGVMTPSLMPTWPDAQHLLDSSSMRVAIVIVTSARLPWKLKSVQDYVPTHQSCGQAGKMDGGPTYHWHSSTVERRVIFRVVWLTQCVPEFGDEWSW